MFKKRGFQSGSVLIIILWVLSLLTVLVINLASRARAELGYAGHLQNRLKMYYLAKAGVERASAELMVNLTAGYDALNEPWSNQNEFFKDVPLGDGFFTVSYHPETQEDQKDIILYGAMDESSKIDINSAPADILKILFERIGGASTEESIDIAAAIVDWRDKDNNLTLGGAEDEYYQSLTLPYKCKNGNFQILEELLLVKGVTEETFSKVKEVATVYPTGRVNINTASFNCLYALGLGESLCERIIEFRKGSDGVIGTEDDGVFKTVSEISNLGHLFTEEAAQLNSLISRNIFTEKSDIFRIHSSGQLKDKERVRSRDIVCVVKRQEDKKPQILYWNEN